MSTFTLSRIPSSSSFFTTSPMVRMVVVRSAESPRNGALWSFTAFTILSVETSFPISITSYPAPLSMMATMFFPISCTSPATVAMINLPLLSTPAFIRCGPSMSIATPTHSAAASMSGMRYSPFSNFLPTSSMGLVRPSRTMVFASTPLSTASLTSSVTAGWPSSPSSTPSSSASTRPWMTLYATFSRSSFSFMNYGSPFSLYSCTPSMPSVSDREGFPVLP